MDREPHVPALIAGRITERLHACGETMDVAVFNGIDSTNTEGNKRARTLTRLLLIAAETQTAGRGRMGHTFCISREKRWRGS